MKPIIKNTFVISITERYIKILARKYLAFILFDVNEQGKTLKQINLKSCRVE